MGGGNGRLTDDIRRTISLKWPLPMNSFHEYLRSGLGQAMMSVFAGTAAVEGLVAIWAATSRAHWFLKSMAVWCAVMLLVPIRAYEPAAVFAVGSTLI